MGHNPIIILGTGPEARIALDIFNDNQVLAYGFITFDPEKVGEELNDISVFGTLEDEDVIQMLKASEVDYAVMESDIDRRMEQFKGIRKYLEKPPANAVHNMAFVSPYAHVGFGNMINATAVVNANVHLDDMNMIHSGVSIEPDSRIGSYCTISSGVRIGSNATIEDEVFIGTGAVIHPGVKVGKGAIIGAGSVVLREVEPGSKVFGNPAQQINS